MVQYLQETYNGDFLEPLCTFIDVGQLLKIGNTLQAPII